jgi:hypothetical protein
MTNDRYTKAVLTVIALSLSVIAIQLTTKDANAQIYTGVRGPVYSPNGAMWVTVCNPTQSPDGQTYCADIVNGGQLRVIPK